MSVPQHVFDLLAPLHKPNTTFTRSGDRISSSTSSQEYLYKTERAGRAATQLVGEAQSLKAMNEACAEIAPRLVGRGQHDGEEWMLSEWHQLSSIPKSEQARLGEMLAQMHLASTPEGQRFGFPVPTCCGATEQDNTPEESWGEFFGKRRIGDMCERIGDKELSRLGSEVQTRVIPHLLGKLDVKASILHGDLWSGNARFSKDRSSPIIFDPSSYYGHSEADLGITRMFGGFSPAFYEAYHARVPKTEPVDEYEQRLQLYEAYHHLNHTLMFGGSYKSGAKGLLGGLLRWADDRGL
ncbi:hypothetical protein Rhopal_001863-T1 [Rhodotorula paludigena]|uniref:protein-ribulosamine 3-kinase n=1 Tax=Rhodotorula paludigena TaxID=86838 RepID=A0AAV5GHR3_9BASI|nr:hypothetical protein Rhopal_001863-T1 [Rhodotorula paludigena]